MDFLKVPTDLLIFDESDSLLFEDPAKFDSFIGSNPCISLTATPGGNGNSLEIDVLKHMNFEILEDQTPPAEL